MNTIKATWTNGQIIPHEAVTWSEGTELDVNESIRPQKIGLDESEWDDSPAGIAARSEWLKTLEPPPLTDEELKANAEWERKFREFNLEAVRKQWEEMDRQNRENP